jgi:hypothetical protein
MRIDPKVREPLSSLTWMRHFPPVESGGGWVEFEAADNNSYQETDGVAGDLIAGGGSTQTNRIQVSVNRDMWPTHTYSRAISIANIDMLRASEDQMMESLDTKYQKALRKSFDSHCNINAYLGYKPLGTTGLINSVSAGVPYYTASYQSGASGPTAWSGKTATQVQEDINWLLSTVWGNANYDIAAIPNTVLVPYQQLTLLNTPMTVGGFASIAEYISTRNTYTQETGKPLTISATPFNKGAGIGNTDRMVAYVCDEEYIGIRILEPLTRMPTVFTGTGYETTYIANLGCVKMHSYNTIGYLDGV